jgi:protein TonB
MAPLQAPIITADAAPPRLRPTPELEPIKAEALERVEEPNTPEPPPELPPEIPPEIPPELAPELPTISTADIFASRDAEMANLAARIQEQSSAYASRTRRRAVSTATTEYIYATYMEAWRRKVERIGNLNYPSEARELGLFGNLILHVAVRSDGSLEGIRVVRSSGHEVLDQAAIRIVQLAAPFAPFPPNIKRETDVLDITRTWQFQRNHELGWGR